MIRTVMFDVLMCLRNHGIDLNLLIAFDLRSVYKVLGEFAAATLGEGKLGQLPPPHDGKSALASIFK